MRRLRPSASPAPQAWPPFQATDGTSTRALDTPVGTSPLLVSTARQVVVVRDNRGHTLALLGVGRETPNGLGEHIAQSTGGEEPFGYAAGRISG